jgi:hypothetical protein
MKKAAIATFPREALIAKFFGEVSIVKVEVEGQQAKRP